MDDDNTTIDPDAAAQISAVRAKDSHAHNMFKLMALLALVGTLILAGAMWWIAADSVQLRSTVSTVSGQQAYAATVAEQLASQLRAMGATPVESPPKPVSQPGATGASGANGAPGPAGRGITSTVITGGHLMVAYSDGSTTDEGQVVGKDGTGITGSAINAAGHLILTYSNGANDDVGNVIGPQGSTGATGAAGASGSDGCGISSVGEDTADNLVVTYTANCPSPGPTVVGPLPTGPSGPPGVAGQPPLSWTQTDELGITQYCTRAANFDPSNPTYTCSPTPPATG